MSFFYIDALRVCHIYMCCLRLTNVQHTKFVHQNQYQSKLIYKQVLIKNLQARTLPTFTVSSFSIYLLLSESWSCKIQHFENGLNSLVYRVIPNIHPQLIIDNDLTYKFAYRYKFILIQKIGSAERTFAMSMLYSGKNVIWRQHMLVLRPFKGIRQRCVVVFVFHTC